MQSCHCDHGDVCSTTPVAVQPDRPLEQRPEVQILTFIATQINDRDEQSTPTTVQTILTERSDFSAYL